MPLSIVCATAPGYSPNFLLQLMFCALIKTCKPRSSGLVENDHQRRLVMDSWLTLPYPMEILYLVSKITL
ncbi:unnamed protein product [Brassica rapa]|uniref:Uncharacterized protein n=1 Tax=Brassica campestris TaxID=3711 RepID=A0A8D9LVK8_BRACM|nr:unnamed protein product [Brassica rapa]